MGPRLKRRFTKSVNQTTPPKSPSRPLKYLPITTKRGQAANVVKKSLPPPTVIPEYSWLAMTVQNQTILQHPQSRFPQINLHLRPPSSTVARTTPTTPAHLQLKWTAIGFPCVPSPYLSISTPKNCGMICICHTKPIHPSFDISSCWRSTSGTVTWCYLRMRVKRPAVTFEACKTELKSMKSNTKGHMQI